MGIQINGQTDTITSIDGSITVGTDLSVPGVLSYDDVTNIDSVGLSTFQNGLNVTGGSVGIGTDNPQTKLEILHIESRRHQFSFDDNFLTIKGANQSGNPETLRFIGGDSLRFHTGSTGSGTEKLRITSDGNVLLGHGTASNLAGGFTKPLAIEGTDAATSSIGIVRNANDDNPPYIYLGKSRGTSAGSNTVVSNGDTLGMVNFAGSRGSGTFGDAVNLRAYADDSFTGSSSPGRFSIWTTPASSSSPLESFVVKSTGAVTAPRNVAWSYRRINGASWGSASSGVTYGGLQYRTPLPLFGTSATDYDTHSALSTFTSGSGTGIKFTAPVGGKYMVTLNMTSVRNNTNNDWGSIGLMVNTTAQATTGSLDYMLDTMYYPDVTSTGAQLGWGGSVIINLSENDYIVPYTMSVENFYSDAQYFFQGYLLG